VWVRLPVNSGEGFSLVKKGPITSKTKPRYLC